MKVSFLVLPFNLDPTKTYNDVWKQTCDLISKNRISKFELIKECFLGRKEWLFASNKALDEQINITKKFCIDVIKNKDDSNFSKRILNKYLLRDLNNFEIDSSNSSIEIEKYFSKLKTIEKITDALKDLINSKNEFITFIHYERQKNKEFCSIHWIVIKLQTNSSHLTETENFFSCLKREFNLSYPQTTFQLGTNGNNEIFPFANYSIASSTFKTEDGFNSVSNKNKIFCLQEKVGETIFNKIDNLIKNQGHSFIHKI